MAGGGGGNKKRFQYCTDASGEILYLRAPQGHSGRSLIDPSLQDSVLNSERFLPVHSSCRMCNQFTFHQFGIDTRRSKFEQQTNSILSACGSHGQNKDPDTIDLNAPLHAQYMHKAWKRDQNTVYWVDINLPIRKGLTFYQTRSNAIILHETLPVYCIPKVVRMGSGETIYEKVFVSPRPPPKISLKHDWMKELGSEDAQRPDGQVVQQFKSFQSNQPIPNPDHDRKGQPVVRTDRTEQPVVGTDPRTAQDGRKTSRSQEIDTRFFFHEDDRKEQPVVETGRTQTRSSDDSKSLNVEMAHDRTGKPVVETHR